MSALIYGVKLKIANRQFKIESGFSLTEVLMAAGILAIGFMLIATLFPVGMKMTATATERTVASIAADEAFAKIRLYGVNLAALAGSGLDDFSYDIIDDPCGIVDPCIFEEEFGYPSADNISWEDKRYFWSALCGDPNGTLVPVTVLVSRKADAGAKFPYWTTGDNPMTGEWTAMPYPKPVPIDGLVVDADKLDISFPYLQYFAEGSVVVGNSTGRHTTVLERDTVDFDITLADAIFENFPINTNVTVWVIPPAVRNAPPAAPIIGGRCPCVGIYQKWIIGF